MALPRGMASIVDALEQGRVHTQRVYKTPSGSSLQRWTDWAFASGQPAYDPRIGTALVFKPENALGNDAIYTGPAQPDAVKHLFSATLRADGAGGPVSLLLFDLLGYYPLIDGDSTDFQPFDNALALPRYSDGAGVLPLLVSSVAPVQLGTSAFIAYTDAAGVSRASPLFGVATNSTPGQILNAPGTVPTSGGLGIPLGAGSAYGVRSVSGIQYTSPPGGLQCLYLIRPVVFLTCNGNQFLATERVFSNCPVIADGSALNLFFYQHGTSATSFFGHFTFIHCPMIQSQDNLVASLSSGKTARYDWNKITGATAYTAGRWYDFSQLNGLPTANTYAGTALAWTAASESSGFGLPHGGAVATDFKHLLNMAAWTTAGTGVPGTLQLVDIQGYWPGSSLNIGIAQTLTGTPALRYANGAGLRLFLAATVTAGAVAHSLNISYTNQTGTAGRTLPVTVAGTVSAIPTHLLHSGTTSNNYGPFLPLASGDTGVQNVASVTLSAASGAGTAALVLVRPLAQITLSVAGVMTQKDLLNQIPSLPRIMDGACLTWLYGSGAATVASSTFAGSTEFVWG